MDENLFPTALGSMVVCVGGYAIVGYVEGRSFDEVVYAIMSIPEASNIYADILDTTPRVAVFVGEKYFFGTNSSVGVVIIVVEGDDKHEVKILSSAGGVGIFNLGYGAHRAYARMIARELGEVVGFRIEKEFSLP